jgi:hypothetical protein
MPTRPDWRRCDFADNLKHVDKPGFAWEFLRRNRAYQSDYNRMIRHTTPGSPDNAAAVALILDRWGLICPLRPECSGKSGAGSMATGIPPDLRPPRRRPR